MERTLLRARTQATQLKFQELFLKHAFNQGRQQQRQATRSLVTTATRVDVVHIPYKGSYKVCRCGSSPKFPFCDRTCERTYPKIKVGPFNVFWSQTSAKPTPVHAVVPVRAFQLLLSTGSAWDVCRCNLEITNTPCNLSCQSLHKPIGRCKVVMLPPVFRTLEDDSGEELELDDGSMDQSGQWEEISIECCDTAEGSVCQSGQSEESPIEGSDIAEGMQE